jgi:RimJ/RimL family protein N-acetyltransferase
MSAAGRQGDLPARAGVRIESWGEGDLPLLRKCLGDSAMMQHLGGPESAEKIAERQTRYQRPDSKQFKILDEASAEGVGWVGYWERDWRGEQVYEIGWSVLPAFWGRGIAGLAALQAIAIATSERTHRFLHAYPSVDNVASNAICRKLGLRLNGPCDFEYPKGSMMRCNDWCLELLAGAAAQPR